MRITAVVAGSLLVALALMPRAVEAQRVSADVVVHGGPVAGRVTVRDGYGTYRRPPVARRPVARRLVILEHARFHSRRQWLGHRYRPVTVYVMDGRYYDRMIGSERRPVREVIVYERDGRYYRDFDERGQGRDHGYRGDHERNHNEDGW